MKCMDGSSDTEMDREGLYEMNRKTKCQKMELPLKWIRFKKKSFFRQVLGGVITFYSLHWHFHFLHFFCQAIS